MRTKFKIPLQTEVSKYIEQKKGWPKVFCDHYAEKFWNHYQASGWKLSSGNPIKDWQACFNSQWQTPKFKEDIDFLNRVSGKVTNGLPKQNDDFGRLDEFILKYSARPADMAFSEFGKWYDFMKANKLLQPLTIEKINELKSIYNNDNLKCRCACVQMTLDGYVRSGWTVAKVMEVRNRL